MKKKLSRRTIKKLKAVEIKREPFKKLDKKEVKNESKPEPNELKDKEDSEFHEKILEESINFAAPVINAEQENLDKNQGKVENLEEFASTLPSTTQKIQANPYINNTNYGPTAIGGNYDSGKYDASGKYDSDLNFTQTNVPDSLRTDTLNPFRTQTSTNDERGSGNRLEESARITQQYRNEREAANRNASPHQTKSKREIF